jgi:uncharacterized protein (DUF433 family)
MHHSQKAKSPAAKSRKAPQPERAQAISLPEAMHLALDRCPAISMNPNIMEGRPCIAGTRIPVRAVLRVIEQYGSIEDVVRCYPHLTPEQAKDALYFSQVLLESPGGVDETALAS